MKYNYLSLVIILTFFSCRPTTLLQSGTTQYKAEGEINKVVVIANTGMLKDRANFEKTLANVFSSSKIKAVSLNKLLGNQDSVLKMNQDKMHDFLVNNEFDAVVQLKFVSMRMEESTSEEQYPTRREYRIMDDTHYSQLIQEYGKREEKGAIFEDIKIKMDIRLLRKVGEKYQVVWSARTESSNPKSNHSLAKACAKKAAHAMKKQEIL